MLNSNKHLSFNDFWEARGAVDRRIAEQLIADFSCSRSEAYPSKGIR
jgi:hypothetical protein